MANKMAVASIKRAIYSATLVTMLAFVAAPVHAAYTNGTWNINNNGNWSGAGNWADGLVPGGAGSTVSLAYNIKGANVVITIDTISRTVGILNIGDPKPPIRGYTLAASGGAALIFDNSGFNAQINKPSQKQATSDTMSAPLLLTSSLNISDATDAMLFISGGITANATGTKTIRNQGTGAGGVTLSGVIGDGAGVVAVTQASTSSALTLAGANTQSGDTTINAGTLVVSNALALQNSTLNYTNGTVNFGQGITAFTLGGLQGTQNIALDNSGAVALTVGNNGSTNTYSGSLSGSGGLTVVGGEQILAGANTYTGTTTITNGTLALAYGTGNLAAGTQVKVDNLGILDLNGNNQTLAGLTGSGTVTNSHSGAAMLTLSFTSSQSFLGQLVGPATLTLTGGGTLNLVGTNSFSYTTVTNGSRLAVNGRHDGGVITVYGGSYLGGTGFVGSVVVNGGIYSPGNSPGTQTVANLMLTNSALLAMELGTNGYDMVIVTNSLVLADTPSLYLALTNYVSGVSPAKIALVDWSSAGYWDGAKGYDTNQWFKLYDPGQSWDGLILTNGLPFSVVGGNTATNIFTLNYDEDFLANGGHMVTLTAVPEPGTASLLGMMGVAWLIRRRRNRQPAV